MNVSHGNLIVARRKHLLFCVYQIWDNARKTLVDSGLSNRFEKILESIEQSCDTIAPIRGAYGPLSSDTIPGVRPGLFELCSTLEPKFHPAARNPVPSFSLHGIIRASRGLCLARACGSPGRRERCPRHASRSHASRCG